MRQEIWVGRSVIFIFLMMKDAITDLLISSQMNTPYDACRRTVDCKAGYALTPRLKERYLYNLIATKQWLRAECS